MADRYYNAQATGANNGTSKLNAFQTAEAAANAMSATGGDTLYCSHTSIEVLTGNFGIDYGQGNRIISVDFSGSTPPVSADWTPGCLISGGAIRNIGFYASAYAFGMRFLAGNDFTVNCTRWVLEQCDLSLHGNSDNVAMQGGELILINSTYTGGGTDHEILPGAGRFAMYGGSVLFGGTLAVLARANNDYGRVEFHGTDLSNGGNGISKLYISSATTTRTIFIFDSCNMDTSTTVAAPINGDDVQVNFYGSYAGDNPYYIQEETYYGVIQTETTIVKDDGSSDGTTPISLKFVGNTKNTSGGMGVILDMPIYFWVNSTGNQTFEVELLTDGVTLTEADMVMELIYPQAGAALKSFASSRTFDDANLPASVVDWTTTGLSNPLKQKISMTVNIGQIGVVQARLRMVKQSAIVYADVKLLASNRQHLVGEGYIDTEAVSCDFPTVGEVTEGTVFDDGNLTGTYKEVPESKAEFGFDYGAGGVEFTGSLAAFTAEYELPQEIILEDQEILIFEGCD